MFQKGQREDLMAMYLHTSEGNDWQWNCYLKEGVKARFNESNARK